MGWARSAAQPAGVSCISCNSIQERSLEENKSPIDGKGPLNASWESLDGKDSLTRRPGLERRPCSPDHMGQILLWALLLYCAQGTNGGSGHLGVSIRGRTPSPTPDTNLQRTASPGRPFDCSLHGEPLGDWLLSRSHHAQEEANYSHDEWIHYFDVAWTVFLSLLVLVVALLFAFIFCGPCFLERITSCTEGFCARMNMVLRIFNRNSGNNYGAFETQSSHAMDARDSAAFEDAEYSETTETTDVHWERTDSEITLEAEDTV